MEMNNGNGLQEKAAKVVSVIFYPLLIPLYGLIIIFTAPTVFWYYIPLKAKLLLFVIFLFDNLLVPMLLMPFFRYRNLISSWTLSGKNERTLPLMTVSLWYAITSYILFRLEIPVFFKAYAYSLTMVSIIVLASARWMKMSAYSAASAVVVAMILSLSIRMSVSLPLYLGLSAILSGVIMSSRLRLNAHNPGEVYSGFIAGFATTCIIMLLLQ